MVVYAPSLKTKMGTASRVKFVSCNPSVNFRSIAATKRKHTRLRNHVSCLTSTEKMENDLEKRSKIAHHTLAVPNMGNRVVDYHALVRYNVTQENVLRWKDWKNADPLCNLMTLKT